MFAVIGIYSFLLDYNLNDRRDCINFLRLLCLQTIKMPGTCI